MASYYKIRQQLDNLSKELLSFIQKPQYLLPFLQPGRLVKVNQLVFKEYSHLCKIKGTSCMEC